jgi:hypothetical protein
MGDNGRMGDRLEERGWNDQIGDNGIKGRGGREGGGGWNESHGLAVESLACSSSSCSRVFSHLLPRVLWNDRIADNGIKGWKRGGGMNLTV